MNFSNDCRKEKGDEIFITFKNDSVKKKWSSKSTRRIIVKKREKERRMTKKVSPNARAPSRFPDMT